jgi:ubiquinone/menaquinone biosynthesis C-methylase UbiE
MPTTKLNPRKPYKGMAMEGIIARWYNKNAATGRGWDKIASMVLSRLRPGGSVLEVAPGPGFLAIELARRGVGRVAGVDISHSFVRIARENAQRAGVSAEFQHGDAAHLPCADASFDYVVCTAAFKNFTDPLGAMNEMHRVLRPGGEASIQDLRRDASPTAINAQVDEMRLSRLNAAWTRFIFRTTLLRNAYTMEGVEEMAAQSRFGGGQATEDGIGFELRMRKG